MKNTKIKPGKLVKTRGREWVILPSDDKDLLRIKPLGGNEAEITNIYLPLGFKNEELEEVYFPEPNQDDIGDLQSAKLLYDALRLSFRDASGPFRSMAKYNFTPRAYQMVPLIMALKQEFPVRLFIADDVGIGKTIESLMIARELFDRREIKRFSIVCLPHLCDQWALEINQKFGFEPVIIRTSTEAQLRRKLPASISLLQYYPFTVVSIDYMKNPKRSSIFVETCPELVIVDEVHTCTSSQDKGRQLRHDLIKKLSAKENQHLVLLSATPHSGKPEQFQSILSFIKPEFEKIKLSEAVQKDRKKVAKHYVQRRREDIKKWVGNSLQEDTPFPERRHFEVGFEHSAEYINIQMEIVGMAKKIATKKLGHKSKTQINYWTALGLIRGVMSSPRMGISMLNKRAKRALTDEEADELAKLNNPILEDDFATSDDNSPTFLMNSVEISNKEWSDLKALSKQLEAVENNKLDNKLKKLEKIIKDWLKEGLNPIIYCRYINTAKYVGEKLAEKFKRQKNIGVLTVTSEDPDELRKEKVESLNQYQQRVLIATDCMSEGINLQELFTAIVHYDLPWNPNRLEQREGRVDRFGQNAPVIKTALLYATNSPMDGIILKVLINKAREIKKSIGISVPFPENNQSIIKTITNAVLLSNNTQPDTSQLSLFSDNELQAAEQKVSNSYKEIEKIEKATRSIFAQHAVKAQEIEKDLEESLRLVGDMKSVEDFVIKAIRHLGGDIQKNKKGYTLYRTGLPPALHHLFEDTQLQIMFSIPLLDGFKYVARNHPLVDGLCQILIAESRLTQSNYAVSRASVIRTSKVETTTTLALFRVRNVIESVATKEQIVAEELHLWGYRGEPDDNEYIDEKECMKLLDTKADGEVFNADRIEYFNDALEEVTEVEDLRNSLARKQAEKLIEAHDRFRKAVKSKRQFQVVEPILPMDIMGIYIFVPNI